MLLKNLSIQQFKNYQSVGCTFHDNINCFVGENGAGKTNLLDAIYYLCLSKSYLNPVDRQNIKHGQDFFVVEGKFTTNSKSERIRCQVQVGKKKELTRNKVPYDKIAEHVGEFPVVIVTPDDNVLVLGGSEERRKYVDNVLSQINRSYLLDLMAYNRTLTQRNSTLKKFAEEERFDPSLLTTYDDALIGPGQRIFERRKEMVEALTPKFQAYYRSISGNRENVSITYKTDLHHTPFASLLEESREKDKILQRTTKGVHRDDLIFTIDGQPAKKFGSQGQQKSFLIALKLAQYDVMLDHHQAAPLLLLDDIFDKLDEERVQNLLQCINKNQFGQIFLTDTSRQRVTSLFAGKEDQVKIMDIVDGQVEANEFEI